MRTTIRIEPHLLARAKEIAAEINTTLTAVIEDALRESFNRRRASAKRRAVKLPTFRGNGLGPGLNLDDSAALLELMEADRDSDRRQRSALNPSKP